MDRYIKVSDLETVVSAAKYTNSNTVDIEIDFKNIPGIACVINTKSIECVEVSKIQEFINTYHLCRGDDVKEIMASLDNLIKPQPKLYGGLGDAISVINELTAENEKLKTTLEDYKLLLNNLGVVG